MKLGFQAHKLLLRSDLSVTPGQEFVQFGDLVVGDAVKIVGEPGYLVE